jgi:hypothetical protein
MVKPWCNHYRGMSHVDGCSAGIRVQQLPGYGQPGFMDTCPCFGPGFVPVCDKAVYPTKEELAAREKELQRMFSNVTTAREAIVSKLGGPWKRGEPSSSGYIDCPICGAKDSLSFRRSGYNGHIHAHCKTDVCVSWME